MKQYHPTTERWGSQERMRGNRLEQHPLYHPPNQPDDFCICPSPWQPHYMGHPPWLLEEGICLGNEILYCFYKNRCLLLWTLVERLFESYMLFPPVVFELSDARKTCIESQSVTGICNGMINTTLDSLTIWAATMYIVVSVHSLEDTYDQVSCHLNTPIFIDTACMNTGIYFLWNSAN